MKKLNIKLITVLTMVILLANILSVFSFASFNIKSADLHSLGSCGNLLKKDGKIIEITYVYYEKDNKQYPAYCLDKSKPGVGEEGDYTVNVDGLVNRVDIWRTITNGYPYKTPGELGCANEKEAFAATKMSVYANIYGYNIEEFSGIGDAGQRVLNAMNIILTNSSRVKVSSDLNITGDTDKLDTDKINSKYISQVYKVTANAPMSNYTVKLTGKVPEGTLITDEKNNVKEEFSAKEKFKILIPIEQLENGGELKINVEAGVETKPIFFGTAPDSKKQDYAITGALYEDGKGEKNLVYSSNETKIKIFKKDGNTKEVLPGAKFDLLDSNKNVMYTNLISDEQGTIIVKNLLPGTYYLKETKAPEGYLVYDDYIKLDIGFNEEISVIVNNNKGDKPTIEVTKNSKEVKQTNIEKKLPKTGM